MCSYKCRKSVFCAIFLACYFVGTICGVFCFRCLSASLDGFEQLHPVEFLRSNGLSGRTVFSVFRPFFVLGVLLLLPNGFRYIFLLITLRGCLSAYLFCAVLHISGGVVPLLIKTFLTLPLYYLLCEFIYFRQLSVCRIC